MGKNEHWIRGRKNLKEGKLELAIRDFTEAIEIDSAVAKSFADRGCAYARLGKYKEAEEDFKKAIKLDPASAEAYCNLGKLYTESGRFAEARNAYESALKLVPKFGSAHIFVMEGFASLEGAIAAAKAQAKIAKC